MLLPARPGVPRAEHTSCRPYQCPATESTWHPRLGQILASLQFPPFAEPAPRQTQELEPMKEHDAFLKSSLKIIWERRDFSRPKAKVIPDRKTLLSGL